ncbi:MAG: hypothetical protein HW390_3403 [Candidatus Brocadiaceae bacterium]|nr:hypothetical protein [Candidatus Brocadiaceae bacterium]
MQSAVPTGLKILASGPTDKSVSYFHLSLWDKMLICKNVGMHPDVFYFKKSDYTFLVPIGTPDNRQAIHCLLRTINKRESRRDD